MLDEPSLGLAPVVTQQVFAVLRTIAEAGVSILIVEQNARAAMNLADRGYVISAGRIAISGAAADLRDDQQLARTYLEMS
jgi:branched-chain amino acid transport system ATP-binding protein